MRTAPLADPLGHGQTECGSQSTPRSSGVGTQPDTWYDDIVTRPLLWLAIFCIPGCMLNRDEVFRANEAPPSGDRESSGGDSSNPGDPTAGDPAAGDPAGTPYALTVDPNTKSATVTQGAQVSILVTLAEEHARQVSWTASSNQTWLTVTPASGTTPATLTVDATTASLSLGAASATVTIEVASPETGSGASVTVSLEVVPPFAAGLDRKSVV